MAEGGRIQGFGGETRRKETTCETQAQMEGSIQMVLQEVGCGGMDWIKLAQDKDRLDEVGSGQGQVAGTCECGDEPSGYIECGEFLDQLKTAQLLKKDCAAWSKEVNKKYFA